MSEKERNMRNIPRRVLFGLVVAATLALGACSGNVGVGLNVGVPVGNHGYMSFGTNRWY
jgi:uncharacterized membrane protein